MGDLSVALPMQHYNSFNDVHLTDAWLTIGIFDGVHLGHQELLRSLISGAHANGSPAVVLTFHPHPAVVLGGKSDFKCLTTPEERNALLESYGVDVVITQTFNRELADQTAEEFMFHLTQNLGLRHLVIGYDTALGRNRAGNAPKLIEIGQKLGYSVQIIPPLRDKSGIISSTRIRTAVSDGDVVSAIADLGRPFSISGSVIHGDGRGHLLNIPTANIQIPTGKILPAFGIYACRAWVGEKTFPAATSIGVRPTFYPLDSSTPTIETHLIDFTGNIYGQILKIEFIQFLRPEVKYESINELLSQIALDIQMTKGILNAHKP